MSSGKEKIIPIFAIFILLIGIISALYVNASQVDKNTILINEKEYSIEEIFSFASERTIQIDEGEKTGIALDELIIKIGIQNPSSHNYIFKAKDSYQQTISWELMQKGVFTRDNRIFFPDTAHSLWVFDIIEIEVN